MRYTFIVLGISIIFISGFAVTRSVQAFANAVEESQQHLLDISIER